jgi:hypothetical protein
MYKLERVQRESKRQTEQSACQNFGLYKKTGGKSKTV